MKRKRTAAGNPERDPHFAFGVFTTAELGQKRVPLPYPRRSDGPVSEDEQAVLDAMHAAFTVPESEKHEDTTVYVACFTNGMRVLASAKSTPQSDAIHGLLPPDVSRYSAAGFHVKSVTEDADGFVASWSPSGGWAVDSRFPFRVSKDPSGSVNLFRRTPDRVDGERIVHGENPLIDFLVTCSPSHEVFLPPPAMPCPIPMGDVLRLVHIRKGGASAVLVGRSDCLGAIPFGPDFVITHSPMRSVGWPHCSEWYDPSWNAASVSPIRETTGLPPCLADLIKSYTGTWTIDFRFLLSGDVRDEYDAVSGTFERAMRAGVIQRERGQTGTRVQATGICRGASLRLSPPGLFLLRSIAAGGPAEVDAGDTTWVILARLISNLCRDGKLRAKGGAAITPRDAVAVLAQII